MTDPLGRLARALADRYTIDRELGRGGMAVVYLARDTKLDRPVALKVLDPQLSITVGHERFLREIAIAAKLNHPNILGLLDSGNADGLLFYVMPYVEGESLSDRLAREGQLPLEDALRITRDVGSALTHAHRLGIVHRDIKPGNILLSGEHTVVADFGIAKAVTDAGGETLTETGLAVGTPFYMSPEQAAGHGAIDSRADIYSLGCVFYQMVVGEPPFTGPSAQAVLARHAIDPVAPMSTVRSTVPVGVDRAVTKAMAKVPADRHTTAQQFVEDLTRAAAAPDPWSVTRRRFPLTWLLGVLAVILMVSGWWWVNVRSGDRGIERLAVLPPVGRGADSEQEPIVEGMYDALLTELGQAGVRVIGSVQSMLRYRSTDLTAAQIAAELNVDALVESSVFWAGDSVGIGVRLIDGRTEESLWSQSYDADARDIIGLYRTVTRGIAGEIRAAVTPSGEARLAAAATVDPAAHEAYLRGRFHANRISPEDLETALDYFGRALEIDSTYAPAYAGISWVWTAKRQMSLTPPAEATPKAIAAAERALAFDSLLADGHGAIANAEGWGLQKWDLAVREFGRALQLNPSSGDLHANFSHVLLVLGQFNEAEAQADSAVALDPFNGRFRGFRAAIYLGTGRVEMARSEYERLARQEPDNVFYRGALIGSSDMAGRFEDVVDMMADRFAAQGMTAWADSLREDYATRGYETAMRTLGDRLAPLGEEGLVPPRAVAQAYGFARDVEGTLTWQERSYELGDPGLVYLAPFAATGQLEWIRDEPRFQTLLQNLHLEWALERQ